MYQFVKSVTDRLLEPYSSWGHFETAATGIIRELTNFESKTAWPWLLSSLVVAYLIYLYDRRRERFPRMKSFWRFVFPKEVYLHRSAIIDYKFVVFDQLIRGLVYTPFTTGVAYYIYLAVVGLLGESSFKLSPWAALWLVPLYGILVVDFGYYLGHRLLHQLPFMWPFHEVHHSAEVLSPVTVFRVHPVEDMFNITVHSVLNAISIAFFTSITNIKFDPYQILGINVVTFLYYVIGFQLRHSHVWLSYGPLLDRIFSSPAQHQVHHSEDEKHWNKNFGLIFSFWDTLFGTLYLPREREEIRFGCGGDPEDFSTLSKLYFLPFVKSYRVIRSRLRLPSISSVRIDASASPERHP